MLSPEREVYEYFQVDRPVLSGADDYVARVKAIADNIFGLTQEGTTLPEFSLESIPSNDGEELDSEPRTVLRTLPQSKANVFRPNDLRMILLRRSAPKAMAGNFNFSAKAYAFNKKRSVFASKPKQSGHRLPRFSVVDEVDGISMRSGLNAKETPVVCNTVIGFDDPVWGYTLALAPKPSLVVTRVLTEQAALSYEGLRKLSPKFAHSGSQTTPCVPFVSLPEDVNDAQYQHFVEFITEKPLLPVRLVMGGVAAYHHETGGKRSQPGQ